MNRRASGNLDFPYGVNNAGSRRSTTSPACPLLGEDQLRKAMVSHSAARASFSLPSISTETA